MIQRLLRKLSPLCTLLPILCVQGSIAAVLNPDWDVVFGRTAGGREQHVAGYVDVNGIQYVLTDEEGTLRLRKFDTNGNQMLMFEPSGPTSDGYHVVTADTAGRIYFAGRDDTGGMTVAKYDATGTHSWTTGFGPGPLWEDDATGMAVDASGAVYVSGYSMQEDFITFSWTSVGRLWVFDGSGGMLWSRSVGGSGLDYAHDVVLDGSGSTFLYGNSGPGVGDWHAWAVKYASGGAMVWTRTVSQYGFWPRRMAAAWRPNDSSLLLAESTGRGFLVQRVDAASGMVGPSLNMAFSTSFIQSEVTDLAMSPTGEVLLAGMERDPAAPGPDAVIAKMDAALSTTTWMLRYAHDEWYAASAAAGFDSAGNVLFNIPTSGTYNFLCADAASTFVKRVTPAGSEVWTRLIDGSPTDLGVDLVSDGAGGAVVTVDGGWYAETRRHDSTGGLVWAKDLAMTGSCGSRPVAITKTGGYYYTVTDGTYQPTGNHEIMVERHDSAGVGGLWGRFDPVKGTGAECADSDSAGNVFVGGGYYSSTTFEDVMLVVKFDSSGSVAWSRTFPLFEGDYPRGCAADGSGGVFVAFNYAKMPDGESLRTLVRISSAGETLWSVTLPGHEAAVQSMCVSGPGLYLAGHDERLAARIQEYDFSGELVWSRTRSFNVLSSLLSIRNDASGNLLAGGFDSDSNYSDLRLYAASWSPSGSIRWTLTENPGPGFDYAMGIAPGSVLMCGGTGQQAFVRRYSEGAGPSAGLSARLSIDPASAGPGTSVQLVLTVTNSGLGDAIDMITTASVIPVTGVAALVSGPVPSGEMTIPAGGSRSFTWTFSVTGYGAAYFTATVSGIDFGTLSPILASRAAPFLSSTPASFAASLSLSPAAACGGIVTIALTTTNTGGFTATVTGAAVGSFGPVSLAGLSGPVPPVPFALAAGASVTQRWTASITGLSAPPHVLWGSVSGLDQLGGGAVWATASMTGSFQPGAVFASSVQAPAAASIGQAFAVVLTVSNSGGFTAGSVSPALWATSGGGSVIPVSGPVPPGPVGVAGGAVQSFVWTFSASGAGVFGFTVTVSGTETCGGTPLVWSRTVAVALQAGAVLNASVTASRTVMRQGERVTVTVYAANGGGAALAGVIPWIGWTPVVPAPLGLVSAPGAGPVSVPGGSTAAFGWTFDALRSGFIVFTASVSGADANAGWGRSVVAALPWTVTVTPAAVLWSHASAVPGVIRAGGAFDVRLTVTNAGDAPASSVAPALVLADAALGAVFAGPSPSGGGILAAGSVAEFVWRVEARAAGRLSLQASLGGFDATLYVSSSAPASADITPGLDEEIAVYPNPVTGGSLTIHLKLEHDADLVELEAFNAAFARVARATWPGVSKYGGPLRLDGVEAWAPGPYLVRVTATYPGGGTRTFPLQRMLVKR